jgi:hypothetical protein
VNPKPKTVAAAALPHFFAQINLSAGKSEAILPIR